MTTAGPAVLALILFGATARAEPPPAAKEGCELRLSGAIDKTTRGAGGLGSVLTDYWMTDAELRRMLLVAMLGSKLTEEEKAKKVDTQMQEDPRAMLLLVSCETPDVTLTFGTSKGSTYKDIRMKARSYAIAPEGESKPGQIVVILQVKPGTSSIFGVEGGTLSITDWDKRHIAARFEIAARSKFVGVPRTLSLKGSFDFTCRLGGACQKP